MKATDIGATVRGIRETLRMTSAGLARKAGISQGQVSRLECGQNGFRSGTLVRIARALGVPPFRLLMTDAEWERWTRRK